MEVSRSGERDRIYYMRALNNRFNCYMVIVQLTCLYIHIYSCVYAYMFVGSRGWMLIDGN